ncbi:MAG: hypothetical protein MUF72_18110 [Elainella sp. Prado103]|jgi:WD40 repeat protein|nr:hypothetical protein [Elainella sp. Prado103]
MMTTNPTVNPTVKIAGYNDQALQELTWVIEAAPGEFSLTFAHCNYTRLRQQLVEQLQRLCPVEIATLTLQPATTTLYSTIQETLQDEKPAALMVLGLEFVFDLPQVLSSANKVREEFRKNFPFPIVIWVNDQVLEQWIQWAPDFKSWGTTTEFVVATEALLEGIQAETDALFARLLDPTTLAPLPHIEVDRWEARTALQDLHRRGQALEPALKASMDFVLGREADAKASREFAALQEISANRYMEAARQYYQQSLEYWQQAGNLERQGILLYHLGRNYFRQATYHESQRLDDSYHHKLGFCLEKAKVYLHQCLVSFSQTHRMDLIGEFIPELGVVLEHQANWPALQKLAEKSLVLHQTDKDLNKLAQDYSFLANVALHQSRWSEAHDYAQQVLNIVRSQPRRDLPLYQAGLFLLAQAQQQLEQFPAAIVTLEEAWKVGEQMRRASGANPQRDLQVLALLHKLYLEQHCYLEAFQVKHAQYSVEQQYGLRAFIGPGRLKSQRQVYLTASDAGKPATIAQEILATGRQQNVQDLINRIKEYRFKLTVLYGQSGVGKSSVIEAGLIPALKQETVRGLAIVPILLRQYTHWIEDLGNRLAESLREAAIPYPTDSHAILNSTQAILEQLQHNEQQHLLSVLIFDQFEEFFFTCQDAVEHENFAHFLCQCLNLSEVKIILSLREDYLHRLLRYSRDLKCQSGANEILYNILSQENLYYIGNLTADDTRSLIHTLTQRSQSYPPELVETLVKDLARLTGDIRPIELQIVGFQLEEEHITTLDQYLENGAQTMVQRYLDDVVADCGVENERAAELVLYLLTDENNTRPIKTQAQLETDLKTITQDLLEMVNPVDFASIAPHRLAAVNPIDLVLEIFVEAGIVLLMHESPADRYQLVHDYLVTIIRHQQETRLPQLKLELEKEKSQRQYAEAERDQALQNLHHQNHELKSLNGILAKQKTGLEEIRQNLIAALVGLVVLTGIVGVFSLLIRRSQVEIMAAHAESLLTSNQELDALVESLRALESSKGLAWVQPIFRRLNQQDMQGEIHQVLQSAVYSVREIDRLESHKGAVRALSFSPSGSQKGQWVATASEDNTVKLWNLGDQSASSQFAQGSETRVRKILGEQPGQHKGVVYSLSFSPDGETLATAGADHTVKLWCRDCDWSCPRTLNGHEGAVYSVSYYGSPESPSETLLASASADHTVKLWRQDGQFLNTLVGHTAPVRSVSFSPDGKQIASASEDGTIILWSPEGNLLKSWSGHAGTIYSISFSLAGNLIATASADTTVKLWSDEGELLQTLTGHQAAVRSASFSPDGQMVATAGEDTAVKLWSVDGHLLQTFTGHEEPIYQVSFRPDRSLATASADTTVKFWQPNPHLREHQGRITAVSFSPIDQRMVTAAEDNTVKLWTHEGQYLRSLSDTQMPVRTIRFSPDGQRIATAGDDNTVKLWDRNGESLLTLSEHQSPVMNMGFSPDGDVLATADAGSIKFWDRQGQVIQTIAQHQPVRDLWFSPNGQTLITIGQDLMIQLRNRDGSLRKTVTVQELEQLGHPKIAQESENSEYPKIDRLAVSPKGELVAIVHRGDNTVTLWRISDQTKLAQLPLDKPLKDLKFSPDGQWVATATKDKMVQLWSLAGEKQPAFTWREEGFVEFLTFSPDTDRIALAGTSGKLILWDWRQDVDTLEELSCERVGDYLRNSKTSVRIVRQICDSPDQE